MTDLKPTDEQQDIIDGVANGDSFKVDAVAGSGKTSTLNMAARAIGDTPALYLVYNRAAANDARKKFPKNVEVKTTSALAYREYVNDYGERLPGSYVPSWEVAKMMRINRPLDLGGAIVIRQHAIAAHAAEAIRRFCYSADTEISEKHVVDIPFGLNLSQEMFMKMEIATWAQKLWRASVMVGSALPFTFDMAFKMYVMSEPSVFFDLIMLDEAQDSNAVVEHFIKQQYAQKVVVGDPAQQLYCQPLGTMVEVPDGRPGGSYATKEVAIENIKAGDLVVTYDNSHVYKKGRPVSHVTRLKHDGRLIRVTTPSGQTSAYTDKHHCVVRVGASLMPKHVVYMMRQGDKFRVGRTRFMYESQNWTFGVAARAKTEKADAAWILSVHDTVAESSLAESLVQHQFGIPGVRFEPTHDRDEMDVKVFWAKYGSNLEAARKCLEGHGRLIDYPLWMAGTTANPIGVRRPFVTAAANLIDGMTVLPLDKVARVRGEDEAPRRLWEEVIVTSEYYKGDIISLEVDDHHTYFGDGILTHNSWRGAVNIMDRFEGDRKTLSQSWRFGEQIAEEADKWLAHTGTGISVKGNPDLDSVVTEKVIDEPDAILCRTNAGAMSHAMSLIAQGKRVAIAGGTKELEKLARAAFDLYEGRSTNHPDLVAFNSWAELRDFTGEGAGSSLKAMVTLIDMHGAGAILDACRATVDETRGNPDVVVSTAHKSKGREWLKVKVAEDFSPPKPTINPLTGDAEPGLISSSEAMLGYVTVTRARQQLDRDGLAWIDDHPALVRNTKKILKEEEL